MTVYFIGAGPGAADLLTLRADRLIRTCDMCLYAGSIVPDEVLAHTPEGAEVINTARMPLEEIIVTMIQADSEGKILPACTRATPRCIRLSRSRYGG